MGLQKAVHRAKEGTSALLLQSGLGNERWAGSMECYCYLRNVQDLLSGGRTPYERRFGMPFHGPVVPFGAMVFYHPISAKDVSRLHQFWVKSLARKIPRLCILRGKNLEGRHIGRRRWGIGGDGHIRTPRQKAQCQGSVNAWRWWKIRIPSRTWFARVSWKRSSSENIHFNQGPPRRRRRAIKSSWRIWRVCFNPFSSLNTGWWGSKRRFLVHFWKFYLPSPRGTQSQTVLAERSIVPNSTEIYRCNQGCKYIIGCYAGEVHWWLQECGWRSRITRCVVRFNQIYNTGSKTTGWIFIVWERLTRKQMTSRPCEQYTHKNSTYRFVQHDHMSSREHAWLKSCKAQDRTSLCRKTIVIHV